MFILNFLKSFLNKIKAAEAYPNTDILHLWEDDYMMLELLPAENIDFIKTETDRISQFGSEHSTTHGFTAITIIEEAPYKTENKLINISALTCILTDAGLDKITRVHMQFVGLLSGDNTPLGFGSSRFAIMCQQHEGTLTALWITGNVQNEDDKRKLVDALHRLGPTYNFIAVNWYRGTFYSLDKLSGIEQFVSQI